MAGTRRISATEFIAQTLVMMCCHPIFVLNLIGAPTMDFTEIAHKWTAPLEGLVEDWEMMYQFGTDDLKLVIGRIIQELKLVVDANIITRIDQAIAQAKVLDALQPHVYLVNAPMLKAAPHNVLRCHMGMYREAVGKARFMIWARAYLTPLILRAYAAQREYVVQQKEWTKEAKAKNKKAVQMQQQQQAQMLASSSTGLSNNGGNGGGRKKKENKAKKAKKA